VPVSGQRVSRSAGQRVSGKRLILIDSRKWARL
jgi:hypothetical protein